MALHALSMLENTAELSMWHRSRRGHMAPAYELLKLPSKCSNASEEKYPSLKTLSVLHCRWPVAESAVATAVPSAVCAASALQLKGFQVAAAAAAAG